MLATTFETATGSVTITDALITGRNERGHALGGGAAHTVIRRVTGIAGTVDLELACAPRPGYGVDVPTIDVTEDGIVFATDSATLYLTSPTTTTTADGSTATAAFTVDEGETIAFALEHASTTAEPRLVWSQAAMLDRLADTTEAWRTWSSLHQSYDGPWADLVWSSGRVLYALTYYPTGAMVAAPTTSLPEVSRRRAQLGLPLRVGPRRVVHAAGPLGGGLPHEANSFFDNLCTVMSARLAQGGELPIMYAIDGDGSDGAGGMGTAVPAATSPSGCCPTSRAGATARPCGSATGRGISDSSTSTASCSTPPTACPRSSTDWARRRGGSSLELADVAADRWTEPDQGIWEIRRRSPATSSTRS